MCMLCDRPDVGVRAGRGTHHARRRRPLRNENTDMKWAKLARLAGSLSQLRAGGEGGSCSVSVTERSHAR